MKQFENKVLFIKDDVMLRQVEKIILESGFKVSSDFNQSFVFSKHKYLQTFDGKEFLILSGT